jgi:hypothetical protein
VPVDGETRLPGNALERDRGAFFSFVKVVKGVDQSL